MGIRSSKSVDLFENSDFNVHTDPQVYCCQVVAPKGNALVIENQGAYSRVLEDGCFQLTPYLESPAQIVDTKEFMVNIPKAAMILKDNVTVICDAVVQIQIKKVKEVIQEISDFLDNVRQRAQAAMRLAVGRMLLAELFTNRESITANVESALNSFFEENEDCAVLKRFEMQDVEPQGIDLTKEAIAERSKYAAIKISEAELYKSNQLSDAKLFNGEMRAEALKQRRQVIGESEKKSIVLKAEAECEAISELSKVLAQNNSKDIVRVKLIQQQLDEVKEMFEHSKCMTAPHDSSEFSVLMNFLNHRNRV